MLKEYLLSGVGWGECFPDVSCQIVMFSCVSGPVMHSSGITAVLIYLGDLEELLYKLPSSF